MLCAEFLTKELGRSKAQSELHRPHPTNLRNARSAERSRAAKAPIRACTKPLYAVYRTLTPDTELERSQVPVPSFPHSLIPSFHQHASIVDRRTTQSRNWLHVDLLVLLKRIVNTRHPIRAAPGRTELPTTVFSDVMVSAHDKTSPLQAVRIPLRANDHLHSTRIVHGADSPDSLSDS